MNVFYCSNINYKELFELDKDESRHLGKVLRMQKGDKVLVTNGRGKLYEAVIENPDPKKSSLLITGESSLYKPRDFSVHIALAPPKSSDRIELFVEKAIELGIDKISFIRSDRSERKNVNIDRLLRVSVSAIKQSLKGSLPEVNELQKLEVFLKEVEAEQKFIAHLEEGEKFHLMNKADKGKSCVVLIGPEGDFTSEEINMAKASGFEPVTLGDYRLRTETAALASCHILNLVNTV